MKVPRLRPSAGVKANEDLESIGTFHPRQKSRENAAGIQTSEKDSHPRPLRSESLRDSVKASLCEHLIPDF